MTNNPNGSQRNPERAERAKDFAAKLAATGMRMNEFAKAAGFTRNVIYNLSKGQAPSTEEQSRRLNEAFVKLRRDEIKH